MSHLITLQQIRDWRPCQPGWKLLLSNLGNPTDLSAKVSFGDIAKSNGAPDALWATRCIDDRRFAVSLILPSVKRVSTHTADPRVHGCIAALDRWLAGDDSVDLDAARAAAAAAAAWAEAWAAAAAAWAARAAGGGERHAQVQDIIALSPLYALREHAAA